MRNRDSKLWRGYQSVGLSGDARGAEDRLRPEEPDPDGTFGSKRLKRFVPEIVPFVLMRRPVVFARATQTRTAPNLARTLR
jgi:hypothetical protein